MEPLNSESRTEKNKFITTIVACALITALVTGGSTYVYQKSKQVKTEANLQTQINHLKDQIKNTKAALPTSQDTTNWKIFTSTSIDLSFRYPTEAKYSEKEPLAERVTQGLKTSGHQLYYSDKNKTYPDFDATTIDFKSEDGIPHDMISGNLDNKTSFTVSALEKDTLITKEVAPGMYQVTGFGNMECSPFIYSYLFVRPPQNSGLKYISFSLGVDNESFAQSEMKEVCEPKAEAITKRVATLNENSDVKVNAEKAMSIAKTFSTK